MQERRARHSALKVDMFCEKCGKPIKNGKKACPHCGAAQASKTAMPMGKIGRVICICVIALVVAVAVVLSAFTPGAATAEQTLQRAVNLSAKQVKASVNAALRDYAPEVDATAKAHSTKLHMELSPALIQTLENDMGLEMEWLQQVDVAMITSFQEDVFYLDLGLYLGEAYILGAECCYDRANGELWLFLPDLQEKPLYGDIDTKDNVGQLTALDYEQIGAILAQEKETVSLVAEKLFVAAFSSVKAEQVYQQTRTVGQNNVEFTVIRGYSDAFTSYKPVGEFANWLKEYTPFRTLLDRISHHTGVDITEEVVSGLSGYAQTPISAGERYDHYVYLDADGKVVGHKVLHKDALIYDVLLPNSTCGAVAIPVSAQVMPGGIAGELLVTWDGNNGRAELVVDNTSLATFAYTGEEIQPYPITAPDGGVDMGDTEAVMQWLYGLDYVQLLSDVMQAGAPEGLVAALLYGLFLQ